MALFLSTYVNKIDKKGRVSVPASFRTTLAGSSFTGVVLFRSYKYSVLEGCSMERMEQLSQSIDTLDLFSDTQEDFSAALFAEACPLSFDGEGRILLPSSLLQYSNISQEAVFVGQGPTFQVWDPNQFKSHQLQVRERIQSSKRTLRLKDPFDLKK